MSLIASASVHWLWVEWAATGICWLVAFAWLARAAEAFVMLKRVPDLRALPEPPSFITSSVGDTQPSGAADAHCPLLSVIVPGCNEEVSIDATVRSLLASRGLPVEVIAVDDRSTDGTGAILDQLLKEFAAENVQLASNRLKVLHIRALPQGWLGKPHALAQGVALATAPYLLFTDADILFQEDALLRALGFLIEQRLDHLVLASTPISRSVGERMMLSTLQVIGVWPVRLWKISDPEARDSIGVGSFGLVRRETLDQIGGWQKLRMEVLEDLRFGWEVKRGHHLRQQVAVGRDLLRLHWAAGAIGIAHNLTKNGFALFEYRTIAAFGAVASLIVFLFAPLAGLFGPPAMRWACLPFVIALLLLFCRDIGKTRVSPAYVLLFPIGCALFVYALSRSIVLTLLRGGVSWRGTFYPLAQLRKAAGPLR